MLCGITHCTLAAVQWAVSRWMAAYMSAQGCLSLLQISANLADREACHLAATDTVKKAEEKLLPVKVLLIAFCYVSLYDRRL